MSDPTQVQLLMKSGAELPAARSVASRAIVKRGARRSAQNPAQALVDVVNAYARYRVVADQEQTKRQAIASRERVLLEEIRQRRELFLTCLERSFDEREAAFAQLFRALDVAIERSDGATMGAVLGQVVDLAKKSPFHSLSDLAAIQTALMDPSTNWSV